MISQSAEKDQIITSLQQQLKQIEQERIQEKDLILLLEDDLREQASKVDKLETALQETLMSKQALEKEYLHQIESVKVELKKALDPLRNVQELCEIIDLNEEIGRGAYGIVKKVSLHGTVCAAKNLHCILIEYADKVQFEAIRTNFLEECIKCNRLVHPNIVQFLGIHYPSEDAKLPWLVMEKMDHSLTSFLAKHMQANVSMNVKISIIHDISLGLRYLHARDIIHRDLSSNNILLAKDLTAKIADLGVAKLIDPDGTRSHTLAPGTLYFLPPEATSTKPRYSKPVDVFSLGCVMIHLMTHEWPIPAAETHYDEILGKKVVLSEVERRQVYLDCIVESSKLKRLILLCLHDSSRLRPVIVRVCEEVESLKSF